MPNYNICIGWMLVCIEQIKRKLYISMQDRITVISKNSNLKGEIQLPLSKSISNRVLMIYAAMSWNMDELNITDADDSQLLKKHLAYISKTENTQYDEPILIDCKNAGTVLRFLCPFLARKTNEYILTGSQRMLQRPIGPLVETLLDMGADIKFMEDEQYPPLHISPSSFQFNEVTIDATLSSQYVSAILLSLPLIKDKTTVKLQGEISSWPYIKMTLDLMADFGIEYSIKEKKIELQGTYVKPTEVYEVEPDWSSASYWYQILAMAGKGEILLRGLTKESLQGDAALIDVFSSLGVQSYEQDNGILIKAEGTINYNQNIDFKEIPDIAPAVIASCAALGVIGKFTGLESLNIKESRRMDIIISNLEKLSYDLRDNGYGEYVLINSCKPENKERDFSAISINTASDHRMVMTFAPFAIIGKSIQIENANSVNKSYPFFWDDMSKFFGIM